MNLKGWDRMNDAKDGKISRILVAILAGMVAVIGLWGGYTYWKNIQYRRGMENGYQRAVQEAEAPSYPPPNSRWSAP